jgi:hypothetical protein
MPDGSRGATSSGEVKHGRIRRIARGLVAARLRRERELAFHGGVDFIPTEQYTADDARRAYDEAAWVVALALRVIGADPH